MGLIAICVIAAFVWAFNYARGINLFVPGNYYYSVYKKSNGLKKGNLVLLNGLKVGIVSDISFHPNKSGDVLVELYVESVLPFSKNSVALIKSTTIIGNKSIEILMRDGQELLPRDTIKGELDREITDVIQSNIDPLMIKVEKTLASMDKALENISEFFVKNELAIKTVFNNTNSSLSNVDKISLDIKDILSEKKEKISNIIDHLDSISVNATAISDTILKSKFYDTINKLNNILADIDNGKGSIGKLIKYDDLYLNFNTTVTELHSVLEDLKLNPSRYVHFSVFGGDKTEYKKPEKDKVEKPEE
ncbi:mammalian cell entry family protein [Ichthyobacterium seriolicida]|uniref:Mammalian cell entry family protein n=1 Tax=Ichthyobacterium seriolicida TaxID=242600 RepID=A0A1J1E381_9FLAO|nr:mammalian cell entry family protein [Ichthyobacterium seriolicida]